MFGVIQCSQIHHEGDERSRTCPGHGYPAWSEDITTFREFANEAEMLKWVETTEKDKYAPKYKLIKYEVLTVKTKISIEVGNKPVASSGGNLWGD